jgi:molybdopterin biosynthesis enzyme
MLKKIRVEDAIGLTLAHDLTKVVPGQCKTAAFRRGHVIKQGDIPEMLSMGKEHVYIIEEEAGEVHEEEAAARLVRAFAGPEMSFSGVKEGRIDMISTIPGLLRVDVELLHEINSVDEIVLSTLHNNTVCQPGTVTAGTKIIPLYIADAKLNQVEKLCATRGKVVRVLPFIRRNVGVVVTGSEVYKGRIQDKFGDTIRGKVEALGGYIENIAIVDDNESMIADAVLDMKFRGCQVIIACGGFSVDPDDVTVEGVEQSGARVVKYGAPVMPGSMCLMAYLGDIPVLGAPACAIWNKATVIDLLLPQAMAGVNITRRDIIALGHGGLCLGCKPCNYPVCPFCK